MPWARRTHRGELRVGDKRETRCRPPKKGLALSDSRHAIAPDASCLNLILLGAKG